MSLFDFLDHIPPYQAYLLEVLVVGFLLLLTARAVNLLKMWQDLTTDHTTGHYVGKDVRITLMFLLGMGISMFAVWSDYQEHRPIGTEIILILFGATSVGAGLKTYDNISQRKVRDSDGPLVQQGTAAPPNEPELMPQGPAE